MTKGNDHSLIINADDFGMDSSVNNSILTAIVDGICTTTTMIVNLEGFEEACDLAEKNKIRDRVGIHVNLTEGIPLTDDMKRCKLFCNSDGEFNFEKNVKRIYHLDSQIRRCVYNEIEAQIKKCRSGGLNISHADSHNHMHEEPGLLMVFMDVLKNQNIRYMRQVKNLAIRSARIKRIYRWAYNYIINKSNFSGTDYFGGIDEYIYYCENKLIDNNSVVEVMIHPGSVVSGDVIDIFDGNNLTEMLNRCIIGRKLITYSDLKKRK
jgi:chitin disaccharide deacetylase